MPRPSRPKDGNQIAKFVVTWLPGLLQTIKKVLEVIRQEHKPTGRVNSAKARAASNTPERRSEVARKAAAVRWKRKRHLS